MSDTVYYVRYRVHGTTLWSNDVPEADFVEVVDGLQPNTTYDIEVVAQNSLGSTASEITQYTTAARAPAAPDGLSVTSVTTVSLVLNWNQSPSGSPPISYQVQYRVHGQPSYVNVGSPTSNTSLLITGLNASTTYDFQVVATNHSGSATSPSLTISTLAQGSPPSAPINMVFTNIGQSQMTVGWSASSGATPITYSVFYRVHGGTTFTAAGTTNNTSFIVSGLLSGTQYDIEITATNLFGSATSAIGQATTASAPIAPSQPGAPTASAITAGTLTLSWTASLTGTAPISYQVQFRLSGQTPAANFANFGAPVQALTQSITGLAAGTAYDFRIVASNAAGTNTSAQTTVSTTSSVSPPSAPTGLFTSNVNPTSLTLGWQPSATGTQPINYQPQFRVTGQSTWNNIGGQILTTSVPVSNLTASTSYDFRVVASNGAGSVTSVTLTITTPATGTSPTTPTVSIGAPVPTAASAVGYNTVTFGPSVQPLTSRLRPFSFFGTVPGTPTANANGSITITTPSTGYGADLCTAGYHSGASAWTVFDGIAFGGGCYAEAIMSQTGGNVNPGMSFWLNDIESMNGGSVGDLTGRHWPGQASDYGNWIEVDIAEFDASGDSYGCGDHNWYGTGGSPSDANTGSYGGFVSPVTPGTSIDWSQPHKYGWLWVPASGSATVTNIQPNTALSGAVVGTPGTVPTGWDRASIGGLSSQVVAIGTTAGGKPYVDFRLFGTADGSDVHVWFEPRDGSTCSAPPSKNFQQTVDLQVIAGTAPGSMYLDTDSLDNTGGYIGSAGLTGITPTSSLVTYTNSILSASGAARLNPQIGFFGPANGTAVDVTFRISNPQLLEQLDTSTQGYQKFFFDGVQVGTTLRWNPWSSTETPPPVQGTTAYNVLDTRHVAFIFGCGNAARPVTVYSLTVYQKDATQNIGAPEADLSTGATATTIPINWTASTGTGNITYTPQYRVTGSGASFTQAPSTTQLFATLTGLTTGTQYDIQVVATNSIGSTTSATVVGTTALTESASGTLLTSATGVIVDANLTQWRLNGTPRTSATVQRNTGAGWISTGSTTTATQVLYWNHVVYYQDNATSNWFSWNGTAWAAAAGDPRTGQESAQGTTLNNATGQIIDANGSTWALAASGTLFQVSMNGIVDLRTHNVTLLLYWNHTVWYEDSSNLWYSYASINNTWSAGQAQDPRTGSTTESANGTTVTTTTSQIVDASGTIWKLVSSTSSGLQIAKAGVVDKNTTNVQTMLYWNHGVYFQNAAGSWYQYSGSQPYPWIATIDPRGSTVTPLFFDDFSTLSLINTRDPSTANNTWHPCFTWNSDGFAQDDSWIVNPFNPATPITDLYTITQPTSSVNPLFLDTFSTFSVYNNYYIQPGVGQFVANGVTYTIDSSGNMLGNGVGLAGGGGTGAGAYYQGQVLGKDAGSNNWYSWDGTQFNGPVTAPPSSFLTTGGTWRYNSFEPAGQGGSDLTGDGLAGDWCLNPLNPATPISGIYVEDSTAGQLKLGILPTPTQYKAAAGNDAFVTTLLSSDITPASTQLFGYFEVTVAVDRLIGFGAEVTLENHHFPWPPEIDLVHIITDANGVMHQTFMVWEGTFPNQTHQKWTQSSASGFDPSAMHSYGVYWTAQTLTFYVDRKQVWQIPASADYQSVPLYFYLLTYQHYTQLGDPDVDAPVITNTAALPVFAHFDQVGVWPSPPFAGQTTGSGSSDLVLACEATPPAYAAACGNKPQVATTLTTQTSFNQQYGYFEAEMQIPAVPGTNGAFLVYSNSSSTLQIDIQEWASGANSDGSRWQVGSTTIWSTDANTVPLNHIYSYDVSSTFDLAAAKHKYGVLLDPSHVTVYWDRVQVAQWPMPPGYIYPLYMLLGTGSGGGWSLSVPGALPTCTPGSGSFTDTFGNTWSVNGSGHPVVNGGTDTGSTVQRLWLYNTTVWQLDAVGSYYEATITGSGQNAGAIPWTGPLTSGPATNDLPLKVNVSYVGCWSGLPFAAPTSATISDIQLSSTTIAGTSPSGSLLGSVTVVMSDGNTFGGTLTLGGPDAASYNLTAALIHTVGTLVAGSTNTITLTATSGAASLQKTFTITITGTGGGGGGTGPNASSSFITVAFQSPMSWAFGSGQQIVSQRYYGTFLGYGADQPSSDVGARGPDTRPFSAFSNSAYTTAMALANPGLFVVTGNENGMNAGSPGTWFTNDGSGNPTIINPSGLANIVNNFYKVDPLGISGVLFGDDMFDTSGGPNNGNFFYSSTVYGQRAAAMTAYFDNNGAGRPMGNGKRFPYLGYAGHNEPDSKSVSQLAPYYNAMTSGVHSVSSGYVTCGPQASFYNGVNTASFLSQSKPDGVSWDAFDQPNGGGNGLGSAMYTQDTYAKQYSNSIINLRGDVPAGYTPKFVLPGGNVGWAGTTDSNIQIYGAMFQAVNMWNCYDQSPWPVWMGTWDDGAQGTNGLLQVDPYNSPNNFVLSPTAYWYGAAVRAVFGPRWNVTTNAAGLMVMACTPPGAHIGVMIINPGRGAQNGKTVAFSNWPVNSTGNATANVWQMTSAVTGPGIDGNRSTVAVTAGMTAALNFPDPSITIIWI